MAIITTDKRKAFYKEQLLSFEYSAELLNFFWLVLGQLDEDKRYYLDTLYTKYTSKRTLPADRVTTKTTIDDFYTDLKTEFDTLYAAIVAERSRVEAIYESYGLEKPIFDYNPKDYNSNWFYKDIISFSEFWGGLNIYSYTYINSTFLSNGMSLNSLRTEIISGLEPMYELYKTFITNILGLIGFSGTLEEYLEQKVPFVDINEIEDNLPSTDPTAPTVSAGTVTPTADGGTFELTVAFGGETPTVNTVVSDTGTVAPGSMSEGVATYTVSGLTSGESATVTYTLTNSVDTATGTVAIPTVATIEIPHLASINSLSNTDLVENEEGVEVASIIANASSNFEDAKLVLLNKDTGKFNVFKLGVSENKDVKWNNLSEGNYQVSLKDGETILDSKELTL